MAWHTGISEPLIEPFDGRAVGTIQATSIHIDQYLVLGRLGAIALDMFKDAGPCYLKMLVSDPGRSVNTPCRVPPWLVPSTPIPPAAPSFRPRTGVLVD
ncbi:MAG: hypothetical protein ACO27P_09725 [Burkholderiaceae bacterium]